MKSIVLAALLLVAWAPATRAQTVDQVMDRVTDLWARGDASALAGLAAADGVSLDLDGKPVGPMGSRQVTAMLKKLFDNRETLAVRLMPAQNVGGSPQRAFAEISWTMRARGTTIPERTSVFIALILEEEGWRITQIRFVHS